MRAFAASAVSVIGLIALPRAALAYRPFDQTDADTAEVNTIELELGPIRFTRGDDRTTFSPGGVFNYGFSDGWELVFDYDADIPLGDVGSSLLLTDLQVKHVLRDGSLQEASGPSVALELGPLFPENLHDEVGGDATLIVSQRWSHVTVHVNGMVEWTRDRAWSTTIGAIVEGPGDWRVRPVAEGYVETERGANLFSGLVGAIWRYRPHVVFDAAVRVIRDDIDSTGTSGELRVGLTWVIPT
jgi:hypothetical protein